MRGIVVHGADDHASRAFHNLLRRFAPRIRKPAHFSSMSASKPFRIPRKFRPRIIFRRNGSNSAQIEPDRASLLGNPRSAFCGVHDGNCCTLCELRYTRSNRSGLSLSILQFGFSVGSAGNSLLECNAWLIGDTFRGKYARHERAATLRDNLLLCTRAHATRWLRLSWRVCTRRMAAMLTQQLGI